MCLKFTCHYKSVLQEAWRCLCLLLYPERKHTMHEMDDFLPVSAVVHVKLCELLMDGTMDPVVARSQIEKINQALLLSLNTRIDLTPTS